MKQISGKDLSGLTEAELFEEIITKKSCPHEVNKRFKYQDCLVNDGLSCCAACWRKNLNKNYRCFGVN